MRFQINWICLALLLSTPVFAVEQVRPKLQGLWSRAGHQSRYKISGNSFEEYKANNPTSPIQVGEIKYPPGKSYAEVTTENRKRKIYSCGESIIAVESFDEKGAFIDDGTVFYSHGIVGEWSDPQTPIGKWRTNNGDIITFLPDGTGIADWHGEDILWNQDADGYVRAIIAQGHRKMTTYELSDDGSKMTIVADNWTKKYIGSSYTRLP